MTYHRRNADKRVMPIDIIGHAHELSAAQEARREAKARWQSTNTRLTLQIRALEAQHKRLLARQAKELAELGPYQDQAVEDQIAEMMANAPD